MLRAPSSPECLGTVPFGVGVAAHPPCSASSGGGGGLLTR